MEEQPMEELFQKVVDESLIDEFDDFLQDTVPKIMQLIEEKEYTTATTVMGLVAIIKGIAKITDEKILIEYAIHGLELDDIDEMPIEEPKD